MRYKFEDDISLSLILVETFGHFVPDSTRENT